jgi:hypothetical protein
MNTTIKTYYQWRRAIKQRHGAGSETTMTMILDITIVFAVGVMVAEFHSTHC